MAELCQIPITDIEVGERLRDGDQDHVGTLAESIEEIGLIQPIEVRELLRGPKKYRLVVGLHRLAACISLGWRQIDAMVVSSDELQARLREAHENVYRHELNALDRAVALAEAKSIYEALHPQTKHGAQGGPSGKRNETDKLSFSKHAAAKTGLDERSIRRAVALVSGLSKPSIARLRGTEVARNASELKQLANLAPEQQAAALDLMLPPRLSGPGTWPPAMSARAAIAKVQGRAVEAAETPLDRKMRTFRSLWDRGGVKLQRLIVQAIEEATGGKFLSDVEIAAMSGGGEP